MNSDTYLLKFSARAGEAIAIPKSVAVVGASDLESGNYYGARVLANLIDAGAEMAIYPINPRLAGEALLDRPVYGALSELPEVPDMVFVVTPVKFVLPSLEEAVALGVQTSVVISSETGSDDDKARFREQIVEIATRSGMRIIGPNSMGLMNGQFKLNGSFASGTIDGTVPPGTIACLSQSGASLSAMLQWFGPSKTGFSWLISTGDECTTGLEELMEALVNDASVKTIMLFLENIADGLRFRRAALVARLAGKPVVMLQVGKSDKGREAVQSHTGRVAGSREMFAAVAEETNVIETQSLVEFFSIGRTLAQRPLRPDNLPRNQRAGVITVSGGAASLSADHLSDAGWELPALTKRTVDALTEATSQEGLHNPVDIGGVWRTNQRMADAIEALALDESIDTIFISLGAGGVFAKGVAEAIVSSAPNITQDIFVAWVGISDEVKRILEQADIPAFEDFLMAVRAADACAKFSAGQHNIDHALELLELLDASPTETTSGDKTPCTWTVTETLSDLRAAGLPCAPFDVVSDLDEKTIADRSEAIGYPIALKLSSSSLNHKSDDGGVALHLANREDVETAVREFQKLASENRLADPSVLIQRMVSGVEILVGIKRDPSLGPMLVVGLGGTMTELYAEIAATPLPTTPTMLRSILSRNARLNMLIDGFRGQPGVDREAVILFLADFAQWALHKGETLQEVDLNPIMVTNDKISIVDARAVWG